MWTRRELKTKAKKSFNKNYWKTVIVSLILAVIVGGATAAGAGAGSKKTTDKKEVSVETTVTDSESLSDSITQVISGDTSDESQAVTKDFVDELMPASVDNVASTSDAFNFPAELKAILIVIAVITAFVAFVLSIALVAFLINPLEVGCKRFFSRNLNQKANVSEITYAFDNNYLTIVKTTFLRDVYTLLWALLLVIPGIIKAYEYRMIPYILADHPEMTSKEAFAKSKQLMKGQKWNAFVLDLSFIGWEILSLLTVRILGVFFVDPYRNMTNAALYEKLEYGALSIEENN